MKKKLSVLAVMALVIVSVVLLTACNPYKWDSGLDAIDSSKPVSSNGGYFVRQGDYVFFINGKGGDLASNEFGDPNILKQSIMRAKIVDGKIDNKTAKVVVPQVIHNEDPNGGFAVYGEWIYYLTPNNELGPDKKPNTTMSNLMRTRTDGRVTQRIATFNTRNVNLFYAQNRILYFEGNAIKYFDASSMKTDKNIDNGKGATAGTLVSDVIEVMWDYDTDYIFYTKQVKGDDAYRGYNELHCIKANGADEKTLISQKTYVDSTVTDEEFNQNIENYYNDIFTIKLLDIMVEKDNQIALYYTKTSIANPNQPQGLFVNKFEANKEFKAKDTEVKISTIVPQGTITPLGYAQGCIASGQDGFVWYNTSTIENGIAKTSEPLVQSGSKVLKVINDYIYYIPSDASALYKAKLEMTVSENPALVMNEKITEWLVMDWDIVKDANGVITQANMYFFAADDYTYLHVVDVLHFNPEDEKFIDIDKEGNKDGKWDEGEPLVDIEGGTPGKWDGKDESSFVGKRTEADQKAYDEAHKNKEEQK